MRIKDSIFDPEGDVAQFRIVDELRVDPRLRLAPGFRRVDGLDRRAAVASGKNVGEQKNGSWKIKV